MNDTLKCRVMGLKDALFSPEYPVAFVCKDYMVFMGNFAYLGLDLYVGLFSKTMADDGS